MSYPEKEIDGLPVWYYIQILLYKTICLYQYKLLYISLIVKNYISIYIQKYIQF